MTLFGVITLDVLRTVKVKTVVTAVFYINSAVSFAVNTTVGTGRKKNKR